TAPAGGTVAGNVYRFSITAVPGATPLPLRPGQQITVVLRGPAGTPGPTLEVWDGTRWTGTETVPLGNTSPDSYAANLTALGDIGLVTVPLAAAGDGGGGGASLIFAAVVGALALVSAALVLALR